jgi:phosphoserine aminotransferase
MGFRANNSSLLPLDPSIKYFLDAADLLRETQLQFTRVIPGFFMDYWGIPHVKTNIEHITFAVDMVNCEAVIPGDGNDVVGMTYTYDMAAFIAELLEVEEWEEFSVVVGDEVTFNQLLEIGEEVRGEICFFLHFLLAVEGVDADETEQEGNSKWCMMMQRR